MTAILVLILGVIILLLSLFISFGGLDALAEAFQRAVSGLSGGLISLYLIFRAIDSLFPDPVKRFIAWVLRRIPNIPTSLQRITMKNEVEGNLNSILKDYGEEGYSVAPYPAELVWLSGQSTTADSFFRKGKVTIVMDYSDDPARNLAEGALLYCRKGLIPETRQYIPSPLMRAIDLTFVDTVLERRNLAGGRFYFTFDILPRECENHPEVRPFFEILDSLEEKGYFTRILLPELRYYASSVKTRASHKSHESQIQDFLQFLEQNSKYWNIGCKVPLDHAGETIRVGVIIVGTPIKLRHEGLRPYVKRIARCGDAGARVVYLVGTDLGAIAIPQIANDAYRRDLINKPKIQSYNALRGDRVEKWRVARLEIPEGISKKFLDEFPEIKDWPDLDLEQP